MKCVLVCQTKSPTSGFRKWGGKVIGDCESPPEVGQPFLMTAAGLEEKCAIRQISTSPVVSVRRKRAGSWEFRTESGSTYSWRRG